MKIVILGDSFASDEVQQSWITLLKRNHQVVNFSKRGISQYRIYKIFLENIKIINSADKFLLWHTNPQRIYLNDDVDVPLRKLESHPDADLVAEDSLGTPGWNNIARMYYKYFFNEDQNQVFFELLCEKIRNSTTIPILECTGFETIDNSIKSFYEVKSQNQGTINHMNQTGNHIVYTWIKQNL
jgi:hypothetical protein